MRCVSRITVVLFAVFAVFVPSPRAETEITAEMILAKVKRNTDKIKSLTATITRTDGPGGEIAFTGRFFFKRPNLRIDFTGPPAFEGTGLSAIRTNEGVITVDEDGYQLGSAAQSGVGGLFNYITGDITDFGKTKVTVAPADDYNKDGELRYYEISIRLPEESADELAPIEQQNSFIRELARSGQIESEDYDAWKKYSLRRPRAASARGEVGDCLFCEKDRDIIVDYEKGVMTEIYVLLDGDVMETVKYDYVFSQGKYVPSRIRFSDGETEFELKLSDIRTAANIPDKIFQYKKNTDN
ncbi:MAG: hypothetical protein CVU78_05040 [Elusimicrobia bacterium HGW-Elusimicrobia-2]|nr:MAG: hypothetical protein CVU78_05040 [Elusimicrobia bacterium HGW-Elusimicrobia-2]